MQCSGEKKFEDVCYYIGHFADLRDEVTWKEAKKDCEGNGDRLVMIRNEKHKGFVKQLALNEPRTKTAI